MLSVRSVALPMRVKSSAESTSMGAVESAAERGFALREPMVMISSRASSSWAAGCSTVAAKANKVKQATNFSVERICEPPIS